MHVQWTLDITNPERDTKKSSLYREFVISKNGKISMGKTYYIINALEIATKNLEVKTHIKMVRSPGNEVDIKGHHIYKDVWSPVIGEILQVEMEPDKLVHKYAVCVRKDGKVVGRLKKRLMGRYAKTIFYFLRGDPFSKCTAKFVGPRCNLGDLKAVKVGFVVCKGVFVAYIFYCTNQCSFIWHIWHGPYFCSKWNHSTVNWRQTLTDGGSVWSIYVLYNYLWLRKTLFCDCSCYRFFVKTLQLFPSKLLGAINIYRQKGQKRGYLQYSTMVLLVSGSFSQRKNILKQLYSS